MDAEHPAGVPAGGAGLTPEVRRERRVAERQLLVLEALTHVERGERDLGGARQVEAVALDAVEVRLLGRQEARAVHRLLPDEHRRQHG